MPIAIIQNGSNQNEKIGIGTIENIEQIVEEKQLGSPAIIMIGEVVLEHPSQLESIAIGAAAEKI
jgi:uroporphyrin-III C-methyltransferase